LCGVSKLKGFVERAERNLMDLIKIISELRREKAAVEDALVYLEQLARAQGRRRGRPPAYLTRRITGETRRKPFSDETRRKMAAAQRRRWAAYRKAHKVEE
jgi:hypothetical protein